MSSKLNKNAARPLSGVRVLVGRARHQAGALSTELRNQGAEVLEIPFIQIRKPRSFRPLDTALKNLASYDWLILTSVNGVEAMWNRLQKLSKPKFVRSQNLSIIQYKSRNLSEVPWILPRKVSWKSGASAPRSVVKKSAASAPVLRIAAIGPATKKSIEQHGVVVDVVPKEYVAESVVRSLRGKVKGKRVLLVRAKIARDVIPQELRKAGAHVDVVEAYETIVPETSRRRLQTALQSKRRPNVVTFTSSSTVKNFVELLGPRKSKRLSGIYMASIGPVTSATLKDLRLPVDIAAREFTIPGLVAAIVDVITSRGLAKA
jgi:uroporphyrinogen-III synthase